MAKMGAAAITKISDITPEVMATYVKEDYTTLTEEQQSLLLTMINTAISYISSQTGIPESTTDTTVSVLDDYEEFVYVVFVLVSDMWDNGNLYVDGKNINNTVDSIIGEHRRNLI